MTAFSASLPFGDVVSDAYNRTMHWFYSLDMQGWFLVLCGAVVLGAFCLRGFGSRSNY